MRNNYDLWFLARIYCRRCRNGVGLRHFKRCDVEDTAMNTAPVIRYFKLPNGDTIASLREDILQSAIAAANRELKRIREERS